MKIAVMGAGAFGTALGGILAGNGYDIDYYDSKVETEKLSDTLSGAKMVLLSVPSKAAPYLLPHLPKEKPLIVATKGILTDEYFKDFRDYMILSGPGFAKDIKAKKKTYLTATDERILELFKAEYLEFDLTKDRKGVLMCGALKNVYALYCGYLKIEPESEKNREFLRAAAGEMRRILAANGAESETVERYCGVGDLKLTCAPDSRNFSFGLKFQADAEYLPEGTVEGLTAVRRILRKEIVIPEKTPLMGELLKIFGRKLEAMKNMEMENSGAAKTSSKSSAAGSENLEVGSENSGANFKKIGRKHGEI